MPLIANARSVEMRSCTLGSPTPKFASQILIPAFAGTGSSLKGRVVKPRLM